MRGARVQYDHTLHSDVIECVRESALFPVKGGNFPYHGTMVPTQQLAIAALDHSITYAMVILLPWKHENIAPLGHSDTPYFFTVIIML